MGDLEEHVRAVCLKTQSSENVVQEMTRDIKQLDVAKRNLISSLKALHHLQILLTGVYSLGSIYLIEKLFTFRLYNNNFQNEQQFQYNRKSAMGSSVIRRCFLSSKTI